jgi:hypothetical protein
VLRSAEGLSVAKLLLDQHNGGSPAWIEGELVRLVIQRLRRHDVADDVDQVDPRLAGQALEGGAAEPVAQEVAYGVEAGFSVGSVGAGDLDDDSDVCDEAGVSGPGHTDTVQHTVRKDKLGPADQFPGDRDNDRTALGGGVIFPEDD